jgi:hypothetical protein
MRPLAAAVGYARFGLAVFPVRPGTKAPLTHHGHLEATTDTATIERWWRRWPDANVGIACRPSRLVVLDVDPRHDGSESLADLEWQHGPLPSTWRALSGGGGPHVYFCAPAGLRMVDGTLAQGIDVKCNGYVVAPPSLHVSGRRYTWECGYEPGALPLAVPPSWVLERVRTARTNGEARPPDEWAALIRAPIAEGERNESIARLAGYLLRRRPAPRVVLELVRVVNQARCRPPLPEHEIERTVESIAQRELARTREGRC